LRRCLPVAFLLPFIAAGCSGVVVQDDPGPRGRYFIGDFDYAAGNGAMQTVVAGNPFGMPKAAFDAHVRDLMRHQNRGVPAEFVEGQTDRTHPLYKVVVGFNLPRALSFSGMCRNPAGLPSRPDSGRLEIAIVFCQGDEGMSGTTGWADNVSGPDDPKFARLVRYATLYMLSDYDYRQDRSIDIRSWLP
jgi:hypothetical protein